MTERNFVFGMHTPLMQAYSKFNDLVYTLKKKIKSLFLPYPFTGDARHTVKPSFVRGILISRFLDQVLFQGVLYSREACLNTLF